MNLREYVEKKYGSKCTGLMSCEADALGVPYPLRPGWIDRHGDTEICGPVLDALVSALSSSRRKASERGLSVLGFQKPPKQDVPLSPRQAKSRSRKAERNRLKIERSEELLRKIGVLRQRRDSPHDHFAKRPEAIKPSYKPTAVFVAGVNVASAEFLRTYEWRQLRLKALIHYGRRCMCCGAAPETGAVMNVDHVKPRKTHPHLALEFGNLQILCHDCNHGKGNWTDADFREPMADAHTMQIIRSIANGK